jgi:hypothetical protein
MNELLNVSWSWGWLGAGLRGADESEEVNDIPSGALRAENGF